MIEIWQRQSVQGDLHPVMQKVQGKIAKLYIDKSERLMISSRRDGEHGLGSFHYIGMAEDYLDPGKSGLKKVSLQEIKTTLNALAAQLGINPAYLQVVEYDWGYHIEFDPT